MANRKKIDLAWILLPAIVAILLISAFAFLSSTDCYTSNAKTYCISGWEVVKQLPHFWAWVIVGFIACGACIVLVYLNETGTWIGENMSGSSGISIALSILGLFLLIAPWLKAMAKKVDGGATLKQTSYHEHSTRNLPPHDRYCRADGPNGLLLEGQLSPRYRLARPDNKELVAQGWRNYPYLDGRCSRLYVRLANKSSVFERSMAGFRWHPQPGEIPEGIFLGRNNS